MNDRSVGWVGTLSERVLKDTAIAFSSSDVELQLDLFAHRAALFYTPTTSIPQKFVGSGPLDITIPIVTADYTEAIELRPPTSPRFWVDLIQRQTMKLRWQPIPKALVRFTRYDYYKIRNDHFISGIKALLDAFKERTSGRTDGHWLYYFGAIIDDAPKFIELEWTQQCVDHPSEARTRIQIEAL
jgi:hypothetical protein